MSKYIVGRGGGGGGSSSSTTSTESPDTLRSASYVKVIDMLGEGEWEEVCVGGLAGVYLDDVPVQNSDGTINYTGLSLETKSGTLGQAAMTISDTTESTASVGVQMLYNSPIETSISNAETDIVRVNVNIPQLTEVNSSTGDINGTMVEYKIEWKSNDNPTWNLVLDGSRTYANTVLVSNTQSPSVTGYSAYQVNFKVTNGYNYVEQSSDYYVTQTFSTAYTLQVNVNSSGWTTINTGVTISTLIDGNFSHTYATDDSNNVQFRLLLVGGGDTAATYTFTSVLGVWLEGTGVQTVRGKSSSAYERQTSFRVSGEAPFVVRCTRLTADSTSSYVNNDTYFASITSVIEEKFRYPGSVLVGMQVDAEQFSSIPTRAYLCKMLKVKIPSNYNPITRAYTGIWDGSFSVAWTDNPAWCFYDLITSERYGLGDRIPESAVDKWALYSIAQYCDELVPNEDDVLEPRFTCNLLIQTREEAYKLINDFASIFRGITYWGLGAVVPVQDCPQDISYAFNNTNVVDGQFNYSSTSVATRYNAVSVTWNNPDDFYRQAVEYVEDTDNIAKLGYLNQTQIVAFGCASRAMARRVGKWLLYTNNNQTDSVSFTTGMEGAIPRPGEVIQISDTLRSQERRGGRVKSSTLSQVVLDALQDFVGGTTYTITVVNTEGNIAENTFTFVNNTTTDTINFTTPFSIAIAKDSIFIIADDNIEPETFRVVSVTEKENHQYEIAAISYDAGKFDFIEQGEQLTPKKLPSTLVYPVEDLKATEVVYASGTSYLSKIELSWSTPTFGKSYKIRIRAADGTIWNYTSNTNSFTFTESVITSYTISVTAVNMFGTESQATETSITLAGKTWNPSNVADAAYQVQNNTSLLIAWEPISDVDVAGYEVRLNNSNWGVDDSNRLFYGSASSFVTEPESQSYTVYIKAFDTTGRYSTTAYTLVIALSSTNAVTNITYSYADTSTTSSTVTFKWDYTVSQFALRHFAITLTKPGMNAIIVNVNSNEWTTSANWIGDATISITAVNLYGWSSTATTSVVTKLLPSQVGEVSTTVSGTSIVLDWPDAVKTSLPIGGYEVRASDAAWGSTNFLFKGTVSGCTLPVDLGTNTWYVKAFDTDSNYSSSARTVIYTVVAPIPPSSISATFEDTSTTSATVTLKWNDVTPVFGLSYYKIGYNGTTVTTKSNFIVLPADWIGNRLFSVSTVDNLGNESTTLDTYVEKLLPNPVLNFRTQVIDNNVLLYWDLPVRTTLPINHVLIKRGDTWNTATTIGTKSGSFTSVFETEGGSYTYWAATVDTDSNQSVPVSVTTKVSQPPDYILHGTQSSSLDGTTSSAVVSQGSLVMPVNTTETWEQHFTNRSWTSPSAQVSAGYPVFIQPTPGSGYYEEVFDFGSIFAGTKVTVNWSGTTVANSIVTRCDISLSDDNTNWDTYTGQTEVYGTNFRYVRVRITATNGSDTGVYELTELNVRLDAKLKNDAGNTTCYSTDASGTIANFNFEYVDVTSITTTAGGTTPLTAVYDFHDVVDDGTYSIVGGVATINITGHTLLSGQRVRLYFTSGTATSGVYTITNVVSANQYQVSTTDSDTSGNVSAYPQSCRLYLFDNNGVRQSGVVSWAVKGY